MDPTPPEGTPPPHRRTAGLRALAALPVSVLTLTALAPVPERATDAAVYAVSLGDGFIAGEAARWKGNAEGDWSKGGVPAALRAATDRTQADNLPLDSVYAPSASDCHRSDTAESLGAKGAPGPHGDVGHPLNLACSGAQARNLLSEPYRSERARIDQLEALLALPRIEVGHVVISTGGSALPETARTCAESWKSNAYCSVNPAITGPMLTAVRNAQKEAADTVAEGRAPDAITVTAGTCRPAHRMRAYGILADPSVRGAPVTRGRYRRLPARSTGDEGDAHGAGGVDGAHRRGGGGAGAGGRNRRLGRCAGLGGPVVEARG
ncbi:hypothetical protein ACF1G0_18940 [Streptomyces sp. NPDC013953]|uniref:hypothetical protein n=1 Tax=Streptomyces sp. NPDC013953 TaxID=3364868 RepID=UPI0036FF8DF0